MKVLLLTTDAYGGHGGIALYNRDLADALSAMPEVEEVVVLPRTMRFAPSGIPEKVRFLREAAGGKARYIASAMRAATERFDLVICGHINLLPLAGLLNLKLRAPLVLIGYGIDVWERPPARSRYWLRHVDAIWTISEITRRRMNDWAAQADSKFSLLPNAVHLDRYGLAERRPDLLARHGLQGSRVIMTLARLPNFERYKGIDEVLEVLPGLLQQIPELKYLIVGDGSDRPRLEAKAEELGLQQHVVFAGLVEEADKADYFRLADAFVMPGRGEGFGFVFLEALACGVPVVGSRLDGSREALLDGALGELVDPTDLASVRDGILLALSKPRAIPPRLAHFAWPEFRARLAVAVHSLKPSARKVA